ncbi:MAG: CYTH and CHAD domain-containing protein [Hyphomicrobiales bacterium]|nr:CYTH and CHAD domain-containing protein [Hyphomicrobiales bacterium]MCP4998904.1 CYTH and CHAD domain-containing protein [Hyphomicrobiales bacterium]
MSSTELEVKLEIGADIVRRLPDNSALRRMTLGHPAKKNLQSTYFDTADHRLRNEKASLRIRWDGKNWIQTLKCGTGVAHGVSNPVEIEILLEEPQLDLDRIDDPKISPWLSDILSDGPLIPVFETEINRDTHLLNCEGIGTVELAIDNGEVRNTQKSAIINEVELELKSGLPVALLSISELLFDDERITASSASKAERGYALTQEPRTENLCPHVFEMPVLTTDLPADRAFKATGRAAAEQVLDHWNLLSVSDDPEVPHQLRIGLRRLRSCLRIFRSFLTSDDLRRLADEARDMGRLTGLLRNADVLLDDIAVPAIEALGRNKKHRAMLKYLKQNRHLQRQCAREAVGSKHWTHLKLNCMLFDQAVDRAFLIAGVPPADESVMAVSCRELERTWQRVEKKGRGFANHRIEERHEMRKTLKTMRYASEYFLQLYPGDDAGRFFTRLRRLQNVFGYLNDVAMAEQLASTIALEHPDRKDLQKSVDRILKWHRNRAKKAMRKADRRWRTLSASPKFWRT